MGIRKAFQKASKVVEDSRREVAKSKPKDEVAQKRNQKNAGGKK